MNLLLCEGLVPPLKTTAAICAISLMLAAMPAPRAEASEANRSDATGLYFSTPINGALHNTAFDVISNNDATTDETQDESGWSLPILGQMGGHNAERQQTLAVQKQALQKQPDKLSATISAGDSYDRVGQQIDKLLDAALERDPQTQVLDRAVAHYRKTLQKVIAETKDATDYLIPYRGFGPSSEAGDVILDEKVKLKSRASSEFARQKHIDETHIKLVSSMMQLAMGLGMADQMRGAEVAQSGFDALKQLAGDEEAQRTRQMLLDRALSKEIPEALYKRGVWDVAEKQSKHKLVVETSMDEDPVVKEITRRVHRYNHKSKIAMASSHVIQATLGAVSLTPSFVGPAAKTALLAYIMATGGPEQVKLLKELYLDKRFESRLKVTSEEAHLALDNYEVAILTRNKVLLSCAESILGQMVPEDTLNQVCGEELVCQRKQTGA